MFAECCRRTEDGLRRRTSTSRGSASLGRKMERTVKTALLSQFTKDFLSHGPARTVLLSTASIVTPGIKQATP